MDIDDPVLAKLVVDLADVRWRFDEKRDEWRRLLLQVLRDYLRAIGFDREALDPLQQLIFEVSDETDGRKPIGEAGAMVFAAAAVTVLKQRGDFATIKEALAKVHKLSGLDAKALNTFRNNLSSGKKSRNLRPAIIQHYETGLAKLREWPTADILAAVANLDRFIR